MDPAVQRAWLQIHFCVLLWGFTAILGKVITLQPLPLVWWRMTLVAAALVLVRRFWTGVKRIAPRLVAIYAGIGVLVSLHWVTFYASVKLANASVAATCMALIPVFIAFVEPLLTRRPFDAREFVFGLAVIPGVALVVGGTPAEMNAGIAVGVLSAFVVAVFASLNKLFITQGDSLAVTGIEMAAGAVFLSILIPLVPLFSAGSGSIVLPEAHDAVLLLVLAIGCTLLPFALSLVAMRQLSAFATTLAVNMEPVYAILLAMLLLGEQRELDPGFYIGVALILAVVFAHPLLTRARA